MLDLFAQFFQHCWGEGGALHKVSLEFIKFYGLRFSHDAVQVPTLLEVAASVCAPLLTTTPPPLLSKLSKLVFPYKCRAQSVVFFISFGVYIYMYVFFFFLSGKKCPTDI